MLVAFIVIGAMLLLWSFQAKKNLKNTISKYAGGYFIDLHENAHVCIYEQQVVYLYRGMGEQKELFRFKIKNLLSVKDASESLAAERKTTRVAIAKWKLDDESESEFCFDFDGEEALINHEKFVKALSICCDPT